MENAVLEKYGRAKKVKYLVGSLDDLKDIVDTVRHMIIKGCDESDLPSLEELITIDALPLKNNLSSFILDLRVPENLLKGNSSKNLTGRKGAKK